MSISAVIVDDERLARVEIRRLLETAHPEVRIAGEARGGGRRTGAGFENLAGLDFSRYRNARDERV